MGYRETFRQWLEEDYFDKETKEELIAVRNDEAEIEDRFFRELEFGTGGLRGVIGAGTNRMNIYTVRKATQGLANYINAREMADKGCAIAYDSRRFSGEFAMEAALCLAANGIHAYVFTSLRPTPELSFALRTLHCAAGIVITASHNPPEYNGYKVYWEDGAQITAPRDKEIIEEVRKVTDFSAVRTISEKEGREKGLLTMIDTEIDDAYMAELKKQIVRPALLKEKAKDVVIVYTPLHGTGLMPVTRVLKETGFTQVHVVEKQADPDPDFSTLSYPNPEDPAAFTLALQKAKEVGADIVLATDPDADRLGVYAFDREKGEYVSFTGNMSGMLIAWYLLSGKQENHAMPKNPAVVKTIVTTNMADALAKDFDISLIEVLTGFKYIGEQIKFFERDHSYEYVFGLEESYGCLAGTHARDKDAVVASLCLCEAAAYCKDQGMTLWDLMLQLYERYGYYKEGLHTVTLKGVAGQEKIGEIMDGLRSDPPKSFGDFKVTAFRDYERDLVRREDGTDGKTGLPRSNVLYYELENDAWCCVRPSGTEPKIKFYMGVKGESLKDSEILLSRLTEEVLKRIKE
ncbi:MAG: phospho-sugar mutase [Lachnospiraceae bacterium]|nr:phospho-sugar mutase [Lachnospiraceae bacterium]